MFGLLKKKFKNLTDKILGKSQEKIKEEAPEVSSDENSLSKSDLDSNSIEKEVLVKEVPLEKTISQQLDSTNVGQTIPIEKKEIVIEKPTEVIREDDIPKEKIIDVKEPVVISKLPVEKPNIKEVIEEPISKEKVILPLSKSKDVILKKTFIDKKTLPLNKEIIDNNKTYSKEYDNLQSKKKEEVKKSAFTTIKSIFSSKIKLSEKEVINFLDDFEISLLEADVSIDSATSIIEDLKKRLVNFSFSKSNLLEDIKLKIKESLTVQLDVDCNLDHYIKKEKDEPLIILLIGPNGAGKTTTIAKFAHLYKSQNKLVVLASADTFRAGSIDQLETHAKRLGVKIVKQTYGSDPAAVSFDAVASAKANKMDVVLIDTAGRQDTNINLMQELQKIKRVVKPHVTIYIGESQAGQAIVDQIQTFEKEIGITGVILTKIDTDPKGGVAISILNELKKPIFYIGTGQEYNDLERFSPEYIIERIV